MLHADALTDYVARGLLPIMGIPGRAFTLEPASPGTTRSRLLLVRIEGMPPLLLRAWERRRQGFKNAEALRHLDGLGLAAPRLVAHDLSARPARLLRGEAGAPIVTVETWIEGAPHADLSEADASVATLRVAGLLARWHGVTRLRWGRPGGGRIWPFAAYTLAGVRRMGHALAAGGWLEEGEARDMQRRFASWRGAIGSIDTFNLVHNDINRRNVIVTSTGEVVPVDLHRLSYEPFPEEVVNASWHFCRKDEALRARFMETYFEHAGHGARVAWEALRGFFEPLNFLKKMYRRGITVGRAQEEDEKMRAWRRLAMQVGPPP
ncbi:MAG: phosphotransferase [Candidatus Polarisedimenticolia bacterium]